MSANKIYLSKRNLQVLLSKVERYERGEETLCTITKYKNRQDPYCMEIGDEEEVDVIAIPDAKYYVGREAGPMHEKDTPHETA